MFGFLLAPANMPFAVAIVLMLAIAVLEGVSTLLGQGASQLLESILPTPEADVDIDIDVDGDIGGQNAIDGEPFGEGALSRLLGWLHVGKVPVLVLLVIFLASFGLAGYIVQSIASNLVNALLPAPLAAIPAAALGIATVRVAGSAFRALMPGDETAAISTETFIGRIAVIIRGTAARGSPAEAKLTDEHGATHYLLVEPDLDDETFSAGEDLLIVSRKGATYRVIRNTSAAMSDRSQPSN